MACVAPDPLSTLKSIWSIGMRVAKENTFSNADNILNAMAPTRYFL